ncbi:hypothetical protein Tco_1136861 [Tanacetum coccineum]
MNTNVVTPSMGKISTVRAKGVTAISLAESNVTFAGSSPHTPTLAVCSPNVTSLSTRRRERDTLCEQEAGGSRSGPKRRRTYIPREREEAEQRLIDDYFGDDEFLPKYPKENFMRRQRYDCTDRLSIGPILKCTSVIRQLAYDTAPDAFDEYLQIDEPDIQKTHELHEQKHGLPGMLRSIDCMHWEWRNCPKALHGQFKRRDHKYTTLMLEAVADKKLWI